MDENTDYYVSNTVTKQSINKNQIALPRAVFLNLCLPRATQFGHLHVYQYLAETLDAKIGLKINKSDNWQHP